MKKLLSLILAVAVVVGLGAVAFATSTDKITGAIKPIDEYVSNIDLYDIRPGTTIELPLTADMFKWSSGTLATIKAPVTQQQIRQGGVKTVISGSNLSFVKSTDIKYKATNVTGGLTTAVVVVEFSNPLVSTKEQNFDFNLFLQVGGSRQPDSRSRFQGTLVNSSESVSSGDTYVNLAGGKILNVTGAVRNIEIDLGNGVVLVTNVFSGQKYYGYSSINFTSDDEKVLSNYSSITDIVRLSTVNLKKTDKYVDMTSYGNAYIYNARGAYIGRASNYLEYSDIYYVSSRDLGGSITTSGSGSGSGTGTGNGSGTGSGSGTGTGSGSGTGTGTGGGSSVSGTIDRATAVSATNTAIAAAKQSGGKTAVVSVRDRAAITADALKGMNTAAANAGMTAQLNASTVEGNAVIGRITIFPGYAANITSDIKLGSHVTGSQVTKTQKAFNTSFSNKLVVFSLDQNDTFGMPVSIAAKVNLSNMNKSNIYLYSFNRSTNKYYSIINPQAWIDTNGYLRFNTTLAGDIIVSEGPLKK